MQAEIIEETKSLIPNQAHKNFICTQDSKTFTKGEKITGTPKIILGERKGKPYTYQLFLTGNHDLIFLNKTNIPMEKTEVTLGAAGEPSNAAVVNLRPNEHFSKDKKYGLVIGAILGFAWAKYKKHDTKHSAKWIAIGAAVGYVAAYIFDAKHTDTATRATGKK